MTHLSKVRLRPLQSAPPRQLKRLRGLLTDIDDTLTRDGAIEPAALRALQDLAEGGIPVIAITGRPSGWSEPFAMQWPLKAIVAENGAVLLRRVVGSQGAALRRDFVADASTRAANAQRLKACAVAVLAEVAGATLARDSAGRLTDMAIDHSEFNHLDDGRMAQVVAVMRRHGLCASVSSIHINGWIGGHSKWTGARWAVEQALGMAFDAADWLYIGDSTNDQLMFERMPLSVGVANIERFVSKLAHWPTYLTRGERGAGVAEVAAALLAAHAD